MKKHLFAAIVLLLAISVSANAQRSLASIFRSWGFIGDSLCSGEMECFDPGNPTVRYVDLYEYSWGQQMCRLLGSEGWNFSHGGQTARGWLAELDGERGWGYAKTHPKQAYIIALGYNDYYSSLRGVKGFSLEEFRADIRTLISNVKSVAPDARFFVLTRPVETDRELGYDAWNDVIRELPGIFTNLYVIDLFREAPAYDETFKEQNYLNGHMSAQGYLWTAWYLMDAIDAIIRAHPDDFRDVALIGTPWHARP